MYKLSEIKELIKILDQSSLQELEIQNEGNKLLLRKPNKVESIQMNQLHDITPPHKSVAERSVINSEETAGVSSHKADVDDQAMLHRIVSPMVGTFYSAPTPESPPFVKMGDKVKEKTVVCIVEAMKLMNDIVADVSGEVIEVLVDNGQLVEYGQPLFLIRR